MAYKSILSVVTDPDAARPAIEKAIVLARAHDAHLEVLCVGVDRTYTGYHYGGMPVQFMEEALEQARAEAAEAEKFVSGRLERAGIRWSSETAVAHLAGLDALVSERARYNDLVVHPRPYCEGCGQEQETALEAALFEGRAPVLVVPPRNEPGPGTGRIVVGWNQSAEALAAIKAALPLLRMADIVSIAMIDPPRHASDRSDPGGRLSQYLARHGVKVEISVLARTMPRISDVLLRHVTDIGAGLLVMGAYGHSRFREALLGGATRYVLEQAEVPVFMAH